MNKQSSSYSSAPSSSQSSSHLAVGFVGATGSTSQAKKVTKRKIKRDDDPPFRAPYVPRAEEKLGFSFE
ncbi:hypothetical protein B9Z55_008992 [Caenorhabditis nigoni]|uniref:Uncharacterized protein n=1 Tax=Caenorhabditis nigoni TaxID=1611254 RepID=A0A2G5UQ07_9PELO|nr:hypothetical protein B9Z55_008992 [Caenorhabditis nigoni]